MGGGLDRLSLHHVRPHRTLTIGLQLLKSKRFTTSLARLGLFLPSILRHTLLCLHCQRCWRSRCLHSMTLIGTFLPRKLLSLKEIATTPSSPASLGLRRLLLEPLQPANIIATALALGLMRLPMLYYTSRIGLLSGCNRPAGPPTISTLACRQGKIARSSCWISRRHKLKSALLCLGLSSVCIYS